MTNSIIEMAREAGIHARCMGVELEAFAALVSAKAIEDFCTKSGQHLTNDATREACVNAALEPLQKQRDELLSALRQVRDLVDAYGSEDDNNAVGNAIAGYESETPSQAVTFKPEFGWSIDGEKFHGRFDSEIEALADAKRSAWAADREVTEAIIGRVRYPTDWIKPDQIGGDIEERIGELLADECGEAAETFTMNAKEREQIGKLVLDAIEAGPGFNCWGVDVIRTASFSELPE